MLDAVKAATTDRSMKDLRQFLFFKMAAGADGRHEAAARAAEAGASQLVVDELMLKTSSPASGTSSLSVPLGLALERAIANNTPRAVFDVMKPFMVEVPLRSRVIINSSSITGAATSEAAAKPVRRLNLSNLDTELTKSIAQVAMTASRRYSTSASCHTRTCKPDIVSLGGPTVI